MGHFFLPLISRTYDLVGPNPMLFHPTHRKLKTTTKPLSKLRDSKLKKATYKPKQTIKSSWICVIDNKIHKNITPKIYKRLHKELKKESPP